MSLRRMYWGKARGVRREATMAVAEHRFDVASYQRQIAEADLRRAKATRTKVADATSRVAHARLAETMARGVYHARRTSTGSYSDALHPRGVHGRFAAKAVKSRRAR